MSYSDESLKQSELEILDVFVKICEQYSLRYFLAGGCAIGAIRHKGFIPWDDDIDVAMPRKDYEKFISISNSVLPKNLFLQNHNTNSEYHQGFSKIRNSNTTFIETPSRHLEMNHGIFIDVFPIDGVPRNFLLRELLFLKSKIVKVLLCRNMISEFHGVRKLLAKLICLFFREKDTVKILNEFEKLVRRYDYDDSNLTVCYFGAYGRNEYVEKAIYGEGFLATFENRRIIIPENYDKYLSMKYGDYMTLPPVDKRIGHHDAEVIDVDLPYTFYRNRYGVDLKKERK